MNKLQLFSGPEFSRFGCSRCSGAYGDGNLIPCQWLLGNNRRNANEHSLSRLSIHETVRQHLALALARWLAHNSTQRSDPPWCASLVHWLCVSICTSFCGWRRALYGSCSLWTEQLYRDLVDQQAVGPIGEGDPFISARLRWLLGAARKQEGRHDTDLSARCSHRTHIHNCCWGPAR